MPNSARTFLLLLAGALATSCAEGDEVGSSTVTFGDPTAAATTTPPTSGASTTTSGTSSATASDAEASTTEGSADATTGPSPTSSGESGGSSSGGVPSEQPVDGMYSDCASAVECFGLTLCMTIKDAGGATIDGYCTKTNCVGPSDCDPAPAGTATAGCFSVTIDDSMESVCALSCDEPKTCPAGMECYAVSGGSICA